MGKNRKQYTPEFKLKAVLEVLKGDKTASQLAGELGVHPQVLSDWKTHFLEESTQVFARAKQASKVRAETKEKAALFEQIGRLKMEVEWLKKKLGHLA